MPDAMSASERRLREAMDRLLAGAPLRIDGRLIEENLCREAKVNRAPMNRTTAALAEWSRRVLGTQPRDKEIGNLKRQLMARRSEIRQLRTRVKELEGQLTIAATAVAELYVENGLLRGEDHTHNVSPMRPTRTNRR